ncbi:DDHD protein [Geosmithia morbida]|uniref:DDHD protein n=1 Tax=Geosmithia morbida TaxID=1094350 RepID=A0A9P5D3Z8_9HYPO|nr:DDHD protein [Geosmithia morbida]KAF4120994.1 DDHD protein [Geosmithia morbida]
MSSNSQDTLAEKSYLSSAVDSINPWAGKQSSTSSEAARYDKAPSGPLAGTPVDTGDHSVTHLYGQSSRTYPPDCPPLKVQWFHAVDVAKRKPLLGKGNSQANQPLKQSAAPKKFSAFSTSDSNSLEARYQKLLEATEEKGGQVPDTEALSSPQAEDSVGKLRAGFERGSQPSKPAVKVPVNEDFLFDYIGKGPSTKVRIFCVEGETVVSDMPVVRRGTWFFQEGSNLKPCEENLSAQLEQVGSENLTYEGYLKLKPWLRVVRSRSQSGSGKVTPISAKEPSRAKKETLAGDRSFPNSSSRVQTSQDSPAHPKTHRLFGTYMNNIATYQDATTAWLCSDTMLSWVTSSVYERFSGGGYMSGIKLTRGYSEPTKGKEKDKDKEKNEATSVTDALGLDERQQRNLKRRSAPATTRSSVDERGDEREGNRNNPQATLQRQFSSFLEGEDEIQQRQEQEIQDYHTQAGESQGRQIDHLILVTHGIGQQLSLRMESVNFVHDVNVLRKTLKSVYSSSEDLKALNSEFGSSQGNCRVQVLPVCWRHLLDFPRQRVKRPEHDLGDLDEEYDCISKYFKPVTDHFTDPSLDDITADGVAFARSLISDLALDVLLYQSSYREEISKIVLQECNRMLKLFMERNPDFHGKVHLMGHSLGSAIFFDILCRQKDAANEAKDSLRFWPPHGGPESAESKEKHDEKHQSMQLQFDVEDFYCLGSPIGLFQMLEGRQVPHTGSIAIALTANHLYCRRTIAARGSTRGAPLGDTASGSLTEDVLLTGGMRSENASTRAVSAGPVSMPKSQQLYNIFHPSDPISYRLEPLVSPAMTTLKPQSLPYTKRGIFDAANQGLTGIGAKVGQSVSGLWSSLSAGIASNMLNRSLGLSNEEVARMTDQAHSGSQRRELGHGMTSSSGEVIGVESRLGEKTDERKRQLAATSGGLSSTSGNDQTLIDEELETLFSQFQKRREDPSKEDGGHGLDEEMRKARRMRNEESKVRALNRNGRIDYTIQESVLDFNPMNTVASHMAYWADVDVNHFILSQLLSSRPQEKKRGS